MCVIKDLPQAEYEVMEVLWREGEATIKRVHAVLSAERKLAYTTVATLLSRLREKGYVDAREQNFAYVFRPLIEKAQVQRRKLDDLVQRVFGGSLVPLAAYIAENSKLTPDQIAALEEMIASGAREEDKDND